jgi:hypothetical protein
MAFASWYAGGGGDVAALREMASPSLLRLVVVHSISVADGDRWWRRATDLGMMSSHLMLAPIVFSLFVL